MSRNHQSQKKQDIIAAFAWVRMAEPGTPDHEAALGNLADIGRRYEDDMRYTVGSVLLAELRNKQKRNTRR